MEESVGWAFEITLKDRLQDNLKDDKTSNANDEHSGKAISQSDEIWNKLRSSNVHAKKMNWNADKNLMNGDELKLVLKSSQKV